MFDSPARRAGSRRDVAMIVQGRAKLWPDGDLPDVRNELEGRCPDDSGQQTPRRRRRPVGMPQARRCAAASLRLARFPLASSQRQCEGRRCKQAASEPGPSFGVVSALADVSTGVRHVGCFWHSTTPRASCDVEKGNGGRRLSGALHPCVTLQRVGGGRRRRCMGHQLRGPWSEGSTAGLSPRR